MLNKTENALTQEHQSAFYGKGYLKLAGFFEEFESATIKDEVDGVLKLKGIITVAEKDNPDLLCRVEDFLFALPSLKNLIDQKVNPLISQLMKEEAVIFKEKINFKWPGGGAFRPHQDYPAYRTFGPDYHITAMISVDSASEENGCLQFCGEYQDLLRDCPSINSKRLMEGREILPQNELGDIREDIQSKLIWKSEPTHHRDLVVFDSYVPHFSAPNNSTTYSRRAIFVTYNAKSFGEFQKEYYHLKREDPGNPMFHVGTPTKINGNGVLAPNSNHQFPSKSTPAVT